MKLSKMKAALCFVVLRDLFIFFNGGEKQQELHVHTHPFNMQLHYCEREGDVTKQKQANFSLRG